MREVRALRLLRGSSNAAPQELPDAGGNVSPHTTRKHIMGMFDQQQAAPDAGTAAPASTPDAASAAPAAAAPTMEVCIAAMPDGTFKVYQESEGADGADDDAGMAGAQTLKSADEACQAAKQLLAGDGQDASGADTSAQGDDSEALFSGGFNQARGIPLNRG